MLGALITFLVAFGAIGLGRWLVGWWTADLDPAARVGVSGLVGLGALGWITLPIGLIPGGFRWGLGVIGLSVVAGLREHDQAGKV